MKTIFLLNLLRSTYRIWVSALERSLKFLDCIHNSKARLPDTNCKWPKPSSKICSRCTIASTTRMRSAPSAWKNSARYRPNPGPSRWKYVYPATTSSVQRALLFGSRITTRAQFAGASSFRRNHNPSSKMIPWTVRTMKAINRT